MKIYLGTAVLMGMLAGFAKMPAQAQTVLSNETLVATTFVVSDTPMRIGAR